MGISAGLEVRHAHGVVHVGGRVAAREEREEALGATLAPGATRPSGAGSRAIDEEPDPYRLCFERDLDRIKHSRPWRRLAGKCQVFIAPEDDHLRTRMTHAVEVAQVAVGIGTPAGLCIPLIEAAALAHDCGHGPAGHASEEAFSPYMPDGAYHHAVYGADVTLSSLNLCAETLDSIRNHSWNRPAPATPEGEAIAWADRIAYVCHDFEDACRSGILAPSDLPEDVAKILGRERSKQIGRLVHGVLDGLSASDSVSMKEEEAGALDAFRDFNFERIYLRPASVAQAGRVVGLLRGLVDRFIGQPLDPELEPHSVEAAAAAVRYVSGMTDRFALRLGVELLGWDPDRLPGGVP